MLKSSSFAEHSQTVRRFGRQEERVLQKRVNLMEALCRQFESKFGLERKVVIKRLRHNLDLSAEIDSKINIMKRSLAPENSKFYKVRERGTATVLKEGWEDEGSGKSRAAALSCSVTIPASIELLQSRGFPVSKTVYQNFVNLRRAQTGYRKLSSRRVTKDQSLCRGGAFISECSIERASKRSTRSQKHNVNPNIECERSLTTPSVHQSRRNSIEIQPIMDAAEEAPPSIVSNAKEENDFDLMLTDCSGSCRSFETSTEDTTIQTYLSNECLHAMENLHKKVNSRLEEIEIIDLHHASVVTRNYPDRIKTFLRRIERFKNLHRDDDEADTGDNPNPEVKVPDQNENQPETSS